MDAKRATSLNVTLLGVLCIAVAAVSLVWQGWEMFDGRDRSLLKGWDDSFYYYWLPSVVIDHDLDFTNQLATGGGLNEEVRQYALNQPLTPTGLMPNKYPPGWALGSLPFFLLAHVSAPAQSTGFEPLYVSSVWAGQLFYAGIGLWLAGQILVRYFPSNVAWLAVLVGWLTSPLVYYQTVRLAMSHSQVFVLSMAVFWLSLKIFHGEAQTRHWTGLGFCAALLFATRNVAVVYLVLPAFIMVVRLRSVRLATALVLGAALPLMVQVIAWRILYGSWLVHSYAGERFDFSHIRVGEVLFSPRHGLFYWHPLLAPAIGAFMLWSRHGSVGRAWLSSLILIILLNAAWPTWWFGLSFGHRGFEVSVFFGMIGLASLFQCTQARPWAHLVLWILAYLAIAWNFMLLALFITHKIPSEEAVSYGDAGRAFAEWIGLAR